MTVIPIVPVKSGGAPGTGASGNATADATQFFRNYTKLEPRIPMAVWVGLRALTLLIALTLAALLMFLPDIGLKLFWRLAIPVVPAVLVIAPGLWRQICPMATLNQLPRLRGFGRALELPPGLKQWAFSLSVGFFVLAVMARGPFLNHSGPSVAIGVLLALALAFAGGVLFKGRSGWCGTFCPLAPIQRTYGQAPLLMVRNGYCNPCVGCQKSCYDFNPRAAVFSDVYDSDPRHAAQRRLFMGLLPGLIVGYFWLDAHPADGVALHAAVLLGACAASAGLYGLAVAFAPANPYRVALLFGAFALAAFYFFAGPIVVGTLSWLLDAQPPAALISGSRSTGVLLALALAAGGLRAEARWRIAQQAPRDAKGTDGAGRAQVGSGTALKERLAQRDAEVTDRQSQITFQIAPDATLLEAIEGAGLKINFGCRAGICGADPVAICEGHEHLSPIGDDERATLRRLGLEGRARLACMCTVEGPVVIDRDPHSAPLPAVAEAVAEPQIDRALESGLQRVVVVGNGVAGMGVAEALRRASPSVHIDVVTAEEHQFYNRMGIGRLVYDAAAQKGLMLMADDWPERQRVTVRLGAVAARIDRPGRVLHLGEGDLLPYDKLVLATGASSIAPYPGFMNQRNAFMLRTAKDAHEIRDFVHRRRAQRAIVIGGGVLGVEAAEALHKLGLKVTILQRGDRLMNAQLDEAGSARLAGYLESIGLRIACDSRIKRWESGAKGMLDAVWLSQDVRLRADVFVAALGIAANTFLAEDAGLALGDNGIRVDGMMRTSDPDIYAVGDAAELRGTPRGLWPIGAAHAAAAVESMLGESLPYATPRIVLQLKCEGIDLRSQGEITPREGDEDFHARDGDEAWWRLIVRHGLLVGGLYVGPPGTSKFFTKLLQQPVDLTPIRAQLRAGSLDGLKDLLRG
jgi:NADPH-dependent 2,4-dienoyl-CoA reductase/sulfur reductase-like enzyme/ferredoxin